MLTLGINAGDYIVIGSDIVVQVTEIDNRVHLNIEAPKSVPIQRGLVYEKQNPTPLCITRGQKNWPHQAQP